MKDQDLMFLLIDPLQPSHTCTQTHESPLLSLKVTQQRKMTGKRKKAKHQ